MTCSTLLRAPWIQRLRRRTSTSIIPLHTLKRTIYTSPNLQGENQLPSSSQQARPALPPWTRTRDLFIQQCLSILFQHTHDPLWKMISELGTGIGTRQGLSDALHAASTPLQPDAVAEGPSAGDSVSRWVYIQHLTQRCSSPSDAVDNLVDPLFTHLEYLPVHQQASMLIFAAAHLATWNLAVPLRKVVECFLDLSHPIHTPPSPGVLTIDNDGHSELYFNLFLRALACTTKFSTPYATHITNTISRLDTLAPYNAVHADTYSALLNSTHNTVEPGNQSHQSTILSPYLASFLLTHMRNSATTGTPKPEHLEALVRFWAKKSVGRSERPTNTRTQSRKIVGELWREMHGLQSSTSSHVESLPAPNAPGEVPNPKDDPALRTNTLYLGAQGSIKKARALLGIFDQASRVSPPSAQPESMTEIDTQLPVPAPHANPELSIEAEHTAALQKVRTKPHLDAYDLTATLHSAANDPSISTTAFVTMFKKLASKYLATTLPGQKERPKKIPLAMHTVYLRGLGFRGKWERARRWWERGVLGVKKGPWAAAAAEEEARKAAALGVEVLKERKEVEMDKMALTVGVQILVRCGRYLEAVETLERFAARPQKPRSDAAEEEGGAVHLSPISIAEIMVSLKRAGRPDLVFRLWESMYTLYGVLHSSEALNLLLQSARMAAVMDAGNVRAQLATIYELGKQKLFPHSSPSSFDPSKPGKNPSGPGIVMDASPERRVDALKTLTSLCGKPYRGGLWSRKPPIDAAREVFLQVLWGSELASPSGLEKVVAPACSVRSDYDSDAGVVGLGVALPRLALQRYTYTPQVHLYEWVPALTSSPGDAGGVPRLVKAPRGVYPHLELTNANWLNYLALLGVGGRAKEVALAMAWMKHVGVKPSRSTLALGMVLWGEVSVEGPLVDLVLGRRMKKRKKDAGDLQQRGEPRDEYERFVWWTEDWVGEENMPGDRDLRKWRGILKAMREASDPAERSQGGE